MFPFLPVIGMQVRLDRNPEWTLHPQFHLLPARFLDRCEMTIGDIDLTPLVGKEFHKQMKNSLRAALGKLAPSRIRHPATGRTDLVDTA